LPGSTFLLIEDLYPTVVSNEDVVGFNVSMNDPFFMGSRKSSGDFATHNQSLCVAVVRHLPIDLAVFRLPRVLKRCTALLDVCRCDRC
jgi:hypothetical protein